MNFAKIFWAAFLGNTRSRRFSVKKGYANLSEKHLCWSLFWIKFQAFRSVTLLKTDFSTGFFLWNLRNSKNTYFDEHHELLLLKHQWMVISDRFLGPATPGGAWPPTFCRAKRKIWKQKRKERVSTQKLLKGCHQGQNIIVLAILGRVEFKNFSCWPTMVADSTFQCSIAPPLWNYFRRPWFYYNHLPLTHLPTNHSPTHLTTCYYHLMWK